MSKFKTGVLLERFMHENHHTTKSYRQPLTAEQAQNKGVVGTNYIQEVTPKVVANAVRIVIRICKIFFQTGLFIIVNNGFEQFLHACRCSSYLKDHPNMSQGTFQNIPRNVPTRPKKRSNTLIANGLHRHSTGRNCKVNDDILIRSGGASSVLPHPLSLACDRCSSLSLNDLATQNSRYTHRLKPHRLCMRLARRGRLTSHRTR